MELPLDSRAVYNERLEKIRTENAERAEERAITSELSQRAMLALAIYSAEQGAS